MRLFPRRLRFWTAALLLAYQAALNAAPAAAGLVPSKSSGATTIASARDADLVVVQRALENKVVAQKLEDYGSSAAEVRVRLASMSDAELHTLASASKGLPSGGDAIGALIGLLVIVLLVILILKLMNKEVVIK